MKTKIISQSFLCALFYMGASATAIGAELNRPEGNGAAAAMNQQHSHGMEHGHAMPAATLAKQGAQPHEHASQEAPSVTDEGMTTALHSHNKESKPMMPSSHAGHNDGH